MLNISPYHKVIIDIFHSISNMYFRRYMLNNIYYIENHIIDHNAGNSRNFQNSADFCEDWMSGKKSYSINTSGSTGIPKPIAITREQMEVSAKMTIKALSLQPNDNTLVCLNTSYIAGKMMLVRGMVGKLNTYVVEPSANPLVQLRDELHIDFMAVVPMQMETMIDVGGNTLEQLNRMKAVIIGGAPISQALQKQIKHLKCPVYATYGMTETVSHIALKRLNGLEAPDVYKVLGGVNIGQDNRGCLTINSALTNHKNITTNDMVELVDAQSFKWLGRVDNVINSGGIKVHPEQLENQVKNILHEQNIDCNLIIAGAHDSTLGEKVVLILETDELDRITIENLKDYLKQSLPAYHVPKGIYCLEKFVYTETNKVKRKETTNLIY